MNSLHTGIVSVWKVNMESSQMLQWCLFWHSADLSPNKMFMVLKGRFIFIPYIVLTSLFYFVFRCRWDNGLKMSRIYSLLPPLSVLALFLPVCLSVQKAGQSSMWSQVCMQISDKLQVHPKTHFQCILDSISVKFEPYELFRKVSKGLYMIWA